MSEPTETATVAFGHQVGAAGPGSEVELPASEIARLRALGFLVDPDLSTELKREFPRHATGGPPRV